MPLANLVGDIKIGLYMQGNMMRIYDEFASYFGYHIVIVFHD